MDDGRAVAVAQQVSRRVQQPGPETVQVQRQYGTGEFCIPPTESDTAELCGVQGDRPYCTGRCAHGRAERGTKIP